MVKKRKTTRKNPPKKSGKDTLQGATTVDSNKSVQSENKNLSLVINQVRDTLRVKKGKANFNEIIDSMFDCPKEQVEEAIKSLLKDGKLREHYGTFYLSKLYEKEVAPEEGNLKLLKEYNLLDIMCDEVSKVIPGNTLAKKAMILSGVGAMYQRTINLMVEGKKGSGKSALAEIMSKYFPKKKYYDDFSPKTFYYMCQKDSYALNKHIVVIDDPEVRMDETKLSVVKSLTSDSETKTISTVKNQVQLELMIRGNFPIWLTSVVLVGEDQLQDRFLVVPIDTNQEYMINVRDKITEKYMSSRREKERIGETEKTLTSLLKFLSNDKAIDTVIPYLNYLNTDMFIGFNRAYKQFLTLIECSALLHKFQRERTEDGEIMAEVEDLIIAWDIMKKIKDQNVTEYKLSDAQKQILKVLPSSAGGQVTPIGNINSEIGPTTHEIANMTGIAYATVRKYLAAMAGLSNADRFRDVPHLVESYGSRQEKRWYRLDEPSGTNGTILGHEFVSLIEAVHRPNDINKEKIKEVGQMGQGKETAEKYLLKCLSLMSVPLVSHVLGEDGESRKLAKESKRTETDLCPTSVPKISLPNAVTDFVKSRNGKAVKEKTLLKEFKKYDSDKVLETLEYLTLNGIIWQPRTGSYKIVA